jgi:hypothetical protein
MIYHENEFYFRADFKVGLKEQLSIPADSCRHKSRLRSRRFIVESGDILLGNPNGSDVQ